MKYAYILLLMFTAGCSFLGSHERIYYRIQQDAVLPPESDNELHRGVFQVLTPSARMGLDGAAIEVETRGGVSKVDNTGWAQPLPAMLEPIIVATVERSHRYGAVTEGRSAAVATRQLQISIERFTLVLDGTPHVDVTLRAVISNPKNGRLLKSVRLSATEPVETVRMHVVIPAFQRALASCLSQLEDAVE